jgi:LuxR family transcriptional regulator, maltose regulon positive regulatory protein
MPLPATDGLLARSGATGAVLAALERFPLAAVHAPAGYGKTSTLALALEHDGRAAAWYTAQRWHADDFIETVVEEVRRVRPGFGRLTLGVAAQRTNAPTAWAERLGATFARELGNVVEPIVVVFDDVHLLSDDAAFAGFLSGAMRVLPRHARIAIAGRTFPAIPLAEWVVQSRAAVLGADDLRMSESEARALAKASGTTLAEHDAAGLVERFDGWPAGLALFFRGPDRSLPTRDGSLPALSAYLIGANLDALSAEQQRFLEDVSVFDALDPNVLERDDAFADAHRLLAELERTGTMLSQSRTSAEYRLHPLLREALVGRVQRARGPAALALLHRRAGDALERSGNIAAALYHYGLAADRAQLVEFLARYADALFLAGHGERAARAARRLAADGVREPAVLRVVAMALRQRGDPAAAALLDEALSGAQTANDRALGVTIRLLQAEDRLAHGSPLDAAALDALVHDAQDATPGERATARTVAGWARAIACDFHGALQYAQDAAAVAGGLQAPRARAAALAAYAATCLGDFAAADVALGSVLRDLEDGADAVLLANTLVWYARIALLWGDAAAARDYAGSGAALVRTLDLPAERCGAALARAEVAASDGDVAACRAAGAEAANSAPAAWYAADRLRAAALARLLVARALHTLGDAARAADECAAGVALAAPGSAVLAAALSEAATRPESLHTAREAIAHTAAIDALDAVLLDDAARSLRDELAAPGQARFAGLLARRRAQLGRAVTPAPAVHPAAPRGSALTPRETEVLALLAQGLTNREMAQRLTLGTRTVETHVERILGKLGATSRTRAVAIALRTELLAAGA